eukprot:g9444.t1
MAEAAWEVAKEDERGSALVGSRVRIWWDGDRVWYEGSVVGYDSASSKHELVYDGVDTDVYMEDLESGSQEWEIGRQNEGGRSTGKAAAADSESGGGAGRKSKYLDMVLEAVSFLNERNGVSLSSIRKWILDKHPETKDKQKASFNSLTIKALMKLVSEGVLEKVKHSFRISPKCAAEREKKAKARAKEEAKAKAKKEPQRSTTAGGASGNKRQVKPAKDVDKASGSRKSPAAVSGRKRSNSAKPPGGRASGVAEANSKMRAELEEATRKRNEFLSERRAILLSFMHDGDNFFTRMDQQRQLEREQREQRVREEAEAAAAAAAAQREAAKLKAAKLEAAKLEAAKLEAAKLEAAKLEAAKLEAAKLEAGRLEAAEKKAEAERSRHRPPNRDHQGGGRGGLMGSRGAGNGLDARARGTVPPEEERPPPALQLPREVEVNPLDDIDFKAIPADPMTVAETLVKMGVLKRKDIAPGAAKVALTGQRCTEWPPLQVDPNSGIPTMEDRDTLGAQIEQQGAFQNYFITWPGSRLQIDDLRELSQPNVDLTFDHIYYLEKRDVVLMPPPEPILGPHGWVYPPHSPPPPTRIIGRTTALRLRSGEFVQHRIGLMKRTQAYAKRSNVPVDNLVTFSIINPHTRQRYNVTREFCAAPCYASIYKRLLRDTLRKNPSLAPILSKQAPSARVARPPAHSAASYLAPGGLSRPGTNTSHGGNGGVDGFPRGRADVGTPSASTAGRGTSAAPGATRARAEADNGPHRRVSSSVSPPRTSSSSSSSSSSNGRRSHQLPRGPGGIDILSGPVTPVKEAAAESGSAARSSHSHSRSVSGADAAAVEAVAAGISGEGVDDAVVAAAAMLGLGAEVFAARGGPGRGAGTAAGAPAKSRSAPVGGYATTGGKARVDAGAFDSDSGLSNGHVDGIGSDANRTSSVRPSATRARQDVSRPEEVAAETAAEESSDARSEGRREGSSQGEPMVRDGRGVVDRPDEMETDAPRGKDGQDQDQDDNEGGGVFSSPTKDEGGRDEEGDEATPRGGAETEGVVKKEEAGADPDERGYRDRSSEDAQVEVAVGNDVPESEPEPEPIHATLHEHQKEGLRWMIRNYDNGMPLVLGDEAGLGKALQSIALIAHLRCLRVSGPFLIVVPADALNGWMSEMAKFCPNLRTVRFHGSKEERNRIKEEEVKDPAEFDVVLSSYEALCAEGVFFKKRFLWRLVIVDQGHRLFVVKKGDKSQSQLSQKLKQVNTICRVVLTDTPPKHNNLRDVWSLLHFLVPDVFTADSADRFEEGADASTGKCDDPVKMDQAASVLSLFMLRRLKAQVKLDLPPCQEVKLLVKLSPAQHLLYRHLLVQLARKDLIAMTAEAQKHDQLAAAAAAAATTAATAETDGGSVAGGGDGDDRAPSQATPEAEGGGGGGGSVEDTNGDGEKAAAMAEAETSTINTTCSKTDEGHYQKLSTLLLQLRKACNHPYMLLDVEPGSGDAEEQAVDNMVAASGKLALLDRMLPRLKERGHRCLIFSQFPSMLDILQDLCLARGYQHARLDGETGHVQRRLEIQRFNAPGSKLSVMLMSTRLGGPTVKLPAADTVILYDSDWNAQVDVLAMERAHRIGQTKPVKVYRLVCSGSVEERMVSQRRGMKDPGAGSRGVSFDGDSRHERSSSVDHESKEQEQEQEQNLALPAGHVHLGDSMSNMSKGELASLIHEGARAIIQIQEEGEVTDAELDKLIDTPAMDAPSITVKHSGGKGSHPLPASPSSPSPSSPSPSPSCSSPPSTSQAKAAAAAAAAAAATAAALAAGGRMVSPPPSSSGKSGGGGGGGKVAGKKRGAGGDRIPSSRPRGLQEADLRRLEGEGRSGGLFGKGMPGGSVLGKRAKKSRIVMVDSDVPGEQSKLAVLADGTEEGDSDALTSSPTKGCGDGAAKEGHRQWRKTATCLICGKVKGPDRSRPLLSCWFCPKSFHAECLEARGTKQDTNAAGSGSGSGSSLVCPQHACVGCAKPTAAAGGVLFRCQTCADAYCQDCLPETEVEAVGRNPQLEALGYLGKQAYWIRCGSCVNDEQVGDTASPSPSPQNDVGSENEGQGRHGEEGDAEGGRGRDKDDNMSGVGRREQGAAQSRESDQSESESESESDSEPEREPKPEPMPFAVALTLLQDHPAAKAAFLQPSESETASSGASSPSGKSKKRNRKAGAVSVDLIAGKVQAGRYRSSVAFESDARQMITQGKGPRSLSPQQKEMLAFFEAEVSPKLRV